MLRTRPTHETRRHEERTASSNAVRNADPPVSMQFIRAMYRHRGWNDCAHVSQYHEPSEICVSLYSISTKLVKITMSHSRRLDHRRHYLDAYAYSNSIVRPLL